MQHRRKFLHKLFGISVIGLIPQLGFPKSPSGKIPATKLLPKALKKGQTIGLIAPGYAFSEKKITEVCNLLSYLGYKTYHTDNLLNRHGYFSNTDEKRAKDVNHMFKNKNVDAILCFRGGYGCTRILKLIDYEVIKKNPKILIGFSDITALLNGIYEMTGLVCFHGPVGTTLDNPFTIKSFQEILSPSKNLLKIHNAKMDTTLKDDSEYERYTITQGTAIGELCGGSLTLINALIGTPYEIDFTNKLVCIEDVEEAPYRIDRMLTQLLDSATFKDANGIVFGVCAGCDEKSNSDNFTLKEVIMDRIKPMGIPAAYGMSFGHIDENFTFPIGTKALFDTKSRTIELLEDYVQN